MTRLATVEGLIRQGIDVQGRILTRLREEIPGLEPRELPRALQSTGVTTGIATDKARLLRGEPTQIASAVETYEAIMEKWERRGIKIESVIDGSATEEPLPSELPTGQSEGESDEG